MNVYLQKLLAPFDPLESGTVVVKHHLQAASSYMPKAVMVGKTVVSELSKEPAVNSYVFTIKGATKHGFPTVREIYVSETEFGMYDVGDVWHRTDPTY